jgi:hypothetical protein
MTRVFGQTLIFTLALSAAVPALAKIETISGQVIDKACYERNKKNSVQKHVDRPIDECLTACAQAGLPLALLTSDGKVYQIVGALAENKNQKLVPHLTHTVSITGEVTMDEEGALKISGTEVTMIHQ